METAYVSTPAELWKKFDVFISCVHYGNTVTREYEGKRPLPLAFTIAEVVAIRIWEAIAARTVCKWKGHDMVDDSYGDAECGYMSSYCKRCGNGGYQILY